MSKYVIRLSKKAEKQLDKIPKHIALPILSAIEKLAENPRPPLCKKLKGYDAYKIRQGNYRVIYEILDTELLIDVIAVGNRKNIYD